MDARGLLTLTGFSPEYKTPDLSPGISASGPGSAVETANKQFMTQQINEHASMERVASDTGGRTFTGSNDLGDALAQAIADGSSYYTLSYAPASNKSDGKFHQIRIQVSEGSFQLEYRRGYFADGDKDLKKHSGKDAADPAMAGIQAAMAPGAPPATQIVFHARVLPSTDPEFRQDQRIETAPGGEMSYDMHLPRQRFVIDIRINVATLRFQTGSDGVRQAQMEMTLVGYDANGKRLNLVDQPFPLRLTENDYRQLLAPGLPLRSLIDLPSGQATLKIAVREVGEERLGSIEIPLTVHGACAGCVTQTPRP